MFRPFDPDTNSQPIVPVGSYDRLSARDKILVDEMILQNISGAYTQMKADLDKQVPFDQLTGAEKLAKFAVDQYLTRRTKTGDEKQSYALERELKVARDILAADRDALTGARQSHEGEELFPTQTEMATQVIQRMIDFDGDDQFNPQTDLPPEQRGPAAPAFPMPTR